MLFRTYLEKNYHSDLTQFRLWCWQNLNDKAHDPYDLFQEVIFKTLRVKDNYEFDNEQKIIDYLWISLRNEVFEKNKKLKEERQNNFNRVVYDVDLIENELIKTMPPDTNKEKERKKREIVFDAILKKAQELCNPFQYHCFRFKIENDYSFTEMAKVTGIPRNYCARYYYQALQIIQDFLGDRTKNDLLNFDLPDDTI